MKSASLFRFKMSIASLVAAVMVIVLPCTLTGCTAQQTQSSKNAAALIAREIPKALPLVATAASIAATILPSEAPLVVGVSASVQLGLASLQQLCSSYAANPSASVWASIEQAVDSLVNENAAALLDAAHIKDPVSRGIAQATLGGLQTALLIIDGYVQSTKTASQVAATAELRPFKLEQIAPYLDHRQVEEATGHSFQSVYAYETAQGF